MKNQNKEWSSKLFTFLLRIVTSITSWKSPSISIFVNSLIPSWILNTKSAFLVLKGNLTSYLLPQWHAFLSQVPHYKSSQGGSNFWSSSL